MSWPRPSQIAQQAAVVGGRAVPVGGEQARTVEGDLHATVSGSGCGAAGGQAVQCHQDVHELVHPVGAGVAGCGSSPGHAGRPGRRAGRRRRARRSGPLASPLRPRRTGSLDRSRNSCSLSRPGRRDQGNAAGERLEHADGGDARQDVHIEAARHVHGGEVAREQGGGCGVGRPAVIAYAVARQRPQRRRPDSARRRGRAAGRRPGRGGTGSAPAPRCARRRPSCRSR